MKKMMKRIGAVLLAVAMMAALSMSAWASNADPGNGDTSNTGGDASGDASAATVTTTNLTAAPTKGDTGKVIINGLEDGDTVSFYQIVEAIYDNNNTTPFIKYQVVGDASKNVFDPTDKTTPIYPTAEELTALANGTKPTSNTKAADVTGKTKAECEAGVALEIGEWLAVITPKSGSGKVYNPMVVSTYYANPNGTQVVEGGKIDVSTDKYTINGTTSYAKSSEPNIDKVILGNSVGDNNTTPAPGTQHDNGNKGDDHKVGDTVTFQVTTQIPSFSKDYEKNIIYEISDKMDAGLTMGSITSVTVGGTAVSASTAINEVNGSTPVTTNTYKQTITEGAGGGFKLEFDDEYLRTFATKTAAECTVVVTYTATINSNATVGFDPTSNTSKLKYSNNPANKNDTKEKESKTHHYSFGIDGNISGSETNVEIQPRKKKWGRELIKVNENGEPQGVAWRENEETPLEYETNEGETITYGLSGAEFEMWQIKDEDGTNYTSDKRWKAVTNANGYFVADSTKEGYGGFTQLDAGTYKFKEIKAPTGYTLDATEHEVVITAEYNTDGTLKKYSISIDGGDTSTYTATYGEKTSTTVKDVVIEDLGVTFGTFFIKNTKTKELPSTGGIGTYVFTVAGVAIMVVAAGLLIVRHKKKA